MKTTDKIIRIKCDVCDEEFACRHSDINIKFSWGSYCSEPCKTRLHAAIVQFGSTTFLNLTEFK